MASWIGTGGANPGDVKTNGNIGAAGADPGYPLDAAGRSRIRGSAAGGGGLWLSKSSTPTSNTTFIGRGTDAENFVGIYSDGGWRIVVKSNGNVGIGDTTPSWDLDVGGWIRADGYIEYSPVFEGDAISLIKKIKPKTKPVKGWAEVDHNSLPEGVKLKATEKRWYNKANNKKMPKDFSPDAKNAANYVIKEKAVLCRSLGGSVQLNLRAIKQLVEKVEKLEKELGALKKK
jgi:hypothetical protein